jgi:heme-degrading monooxygenase HmoA
MYIIIWQYKINPAYRSEFETLYGQDGDWIKLFKRSDQFIETEFYQCKEDEERYITIDKWVTEEAYRAFKEAHLEDYQALDRKADDATNRESKIGSFFLK